MAKHSKKHGTHYGKEQCGQDDIGEKNRPKHASPMKALKSYSKGGSSRGAAHGSAR